MKTRLLVVDGDINFGSEVEKYFSNSGSIEIAGICNCKTEALKKLENVDVILVNMVLNGLESIEIIEEVKKNPYIKIIATSEFVTSELSSFVNKYDVNYFIKKPFTLESLETLVNSICVKTTKDKEEKVLTVQITNMLHLLGIPSHIKGYAYIREGVQLVYNLKELSGSVTRVVYPEIAKVYNTTTSRVERAIRHAIEVSWIRGDYQAMEKFFGNSVDFDRSRPTNSEFIATLADRLRLENM